MFTQQIFDNQHSLSHIHKMTRAVSSGVVLEIGLLLGLDLQDSLHVILVVQLSGSTAQRDHPSLHTHGFALGSVEVVGAASQLLVVDVRTDVHLAGVNLHDASSGLFVGHGELDLPVETT